MGTGAGMTSIGEPAAEGAGMQIDEESDKIRSDPAIRRGSSLGSYNYPIWLDDPIYSDADDDTAVEDCIAAN